jgi:hypothetical protein
MNKVWLKVLVAISAIMIAGSAAFFSVTGLGVLFSGAAVAVMIMAGSLEFAKLVTATYLKQEWDSIKGINKWYLTTAVVILMLITSAGIFGYLSNAFQQQNLKLEQVSREIQVWQNKIDFTNQQITTLQSQSKDLSTTQNTLLSKGNVNSRLIKSADNRDKQSTAIAKKINSLQDSIVVYNGKINDVKNNNVGIEREVGGFRFVAESFGVPLNTVVKFFIILIVIVFDPLAVALVISFNQLVLATKKKDDEEVPTTEVEAKDIVAEVSRIRLSEDDLKKLEEVLLNPPPPNENFKKAAQEYNKEFKEPSVDIDEINSLIQEDLSEQMTFDEDEFRMNIIGQNGNEGLHYEVETLTPTPTIIPTLTSTPSLTPTPTPTDTPTPTPSIIDEIHVRANGGNFFNDPAEGYTPETLEIKEDDVLEKLNDFQSETFSQEATKIESEEELKKKLLEFPQEDLETTILEEIPMSESIESKENLYWESDDINPNQVIYNLENDQITIPSSDEEIITEPTPTPPTNKILSRNVNPRRRSFR